MMRLKITTTAGVLEYDDVKEYAWGFIFFFIARKNMTDRVNRDMIITIDRWIESKWVRLPERKKTARQT